MRYPTLGPSALALVPVPMLISGREGSETFHTCPPVPSLMHF